MPLLSGSFSLWLGSFCHIVWGVHSLAMTRNVHIDNRWAHGNLSNPQGSLHPQVGTSIDFVPFQTFRSQGVFCVGEGARNLEVILHRVIEWDLICEAHRLFGGLRMFPRPSHCRAGWGSRVLARLADCPSHGFSWTPSGRLLACLVDGTTRVWNIETEAGTSEGCWEKSDRKLRSLF